MEQSQKLLRSVGLPVSFLGFVFFLSSLLLRVSIPLSLSLSVSFLSCPQKKGGAGRKDLKAHVRSTHSAAIPDVGGELGDRRPAQCCLVAAFSPSSRDVKFNLEACYFRLSPVHFWSPSIESPAITLSPSRVLTLVLS